MHDQTELVEVFGQLVETLEREAGAYQRAAGLAQVGNVNSLAIHESAAALACGELLGARDIEHDTGAQLAIAGDSYRDRIFRITVEKICRPIQRIGDDDDAFTWDDVGRKLLAEYGCRRQAAPDDVTNRVLACFVHFTDEIRAAFGFPDELFALSRRVADHARSGVGCFQRGLEKDSVARSLLCICLQLDSLAL